MLKGLSCLYFLIRMALEAHVIRDSAPMCSTFIHKTKESNVLWVLYRCVQCETALPERRFQKHYRMQPMLYSLVF